MAGLVDNVSHRILRLARGIAAVNGSALRSGRKLAMVANSIIVGDGAKCGQLGIKLAVMPGMGGSQRLMRAIGKVSMMKICLTGRMIDAGEAEAAGLVARVVPAVELVDEALKTATRIAEMAPLAAVARKETISAAFETTLQQRLVFERRGFFGTKD